MEKKIPFIQTNRAMLWRNLVLYLMLLLALWFFYGPESVLDDSMKSSVDFIYSRF